MALPSKSRVIHYFPQLVTFCHGLGIIFFKDFYEWTGKYSIMIMTVEVLKKVLDHIPDDYEITFNDKGIEHIVQDKVEIDVSGKKLVLKS